MPSKMVTDRQKSSRFVEAAATTHAAEIAAALGATLAPALAEGETVPDLDLLQSLIARLLAERRRRMVEADEAHLAELTDDLDPRRRRDETADELHLRVVDLRSLVQGLFGPTADVEILGIDGLTAREPTALHRQARRIVERLGDPGLTLPEPRFAGITVDPSAWAEGLVPLTDELAGHLDAVAREEREAETTLLAKTAAIESYDVDFLRLARLLEALYAAAGAEGLAERVRPSGRRPGQTHLEPPAESEGEADPAGEPGGESPDPDSRAPVGDAGA